MLEFIGASDFYRLSDIKPITLCGVSWVRNTQDIGEKL
jgi:hypothetical protein